MGGRCPLHGPLRCLRSACRRASVRPDGGSGPRRPRPRPPQAGALLQRSEP